MVGSFVGPALPSPPADRHGFSLWCLELYRRGYSVRFIAKRAGTTERAVRFALERGERNAEH